MTRAAILWLLAWLVILTLGNAAYRTVYPIEPQLMIDAQATDAPCAVVPAPQVQGIPVQPSDAWRIA